MLEISTRRVAEAAGHKWYFTAKPCKYGHTDERRTHNGACRGCEIRMAHSPERKAYQKSYYHIEHRNNRIRRPLKAMLNAAKQRARRQALPFSITESDLVLRDNCPCCGVAMFLALDSKRAAETTPSLDRLDPAEGYIKGNVEIICWRCNRLKSNASPTELRVIADWMDKQTRSVSQVRIAA